MKRYVTLILIMANPLSVRQGRNLTTRYTYDPTRRTMTETKTRKGESFLQHFSYTYDNFGNLATRKDVSRNMEEIFTYDEMDRLTEVKMGNDSLVYTYGYGHQRIAMEEHVGNTVRTKRYVGACERVTETMGSLTTDRWLTYLTGPTGVYAVVVTMNGTNTLHYILKDNLGSWTTITDSDGVVEQRLSYDAWGNLRDPNTWNGSFTGTPMFDRGFTGHEHLYNFGLINMKFTVSERSAKLCLSTAERCELGEANGRMYDPMMSSFLSVDQYVQSPDNSQNFNRYAYCLNNPLRYVDPDGELWWEAAIVGAIIGSFANATAQVMSGNVNNSSQFWMAAGIGALSGALGGVAGYGVGYGMTALLHGAEGFWLGSVVGSSSGFVGGFVGTSTAAWMQGASFSQGFWAGLKSAGWGAFLGGVLGGLEAGYYAKQCKGNFWTGDDIVVAEHHTGNQYHGSKTRASINAKRYNNSSAFIDDVKTIKSRMNNIYDNWESLVSGEIETRSGNYGMTDDLKSYVNIDEENGKGYSLVDGFVSKRRTGLFNNVVKYDVHIAPGVTAYDVVSFKAVVGHELIHSFHYNLFGFNFDSAQSERVAYQYTIETYENAGYYLNAHQNRIVASQYGYSNIRPNHFYITPF